MHTAALIAEVRGRGRARAGGGHLGQCTAGLRAGAMSAAGSARPPADRRLRPAPPRGRRHAERHPGAGRRAARATWCWKWAPPAACSRGRCRAAPAPCTPSRSTPASRRRCWRWPRNVRRCTCTSRDALKADLASLRPRPTAMVANLAYNIAIPLIVRSLDELPGIGSWSVMVQKELADRLFAKPRTKAYSSVSVAGAAVLRAGGAAGGAAHRLLAAAARGLVVRRVPAALRRASPSNSTESSIGSCGPPSHSAAR